MKLTRRKAERLLRQAEVLKDKNIWSEVPEYPRRDWINEVVNGETNRGYWDWVFFAIQWDRGEQF